MPLETWSQLKKIALLGTERTPEELPHTEIELPAEREGALLSLIALASLQRQVSLVPVSVSFAEVEACPDETLICAPPQAASRLSHLLAARDDVLLREWLRLAARAQVLAPRGVLPEIMRRASQSSTLRALALPLLGERGRWLARQRGDWKWAVTEASEDHEQTFHGGSGTARREAFRSLRREEPGRAREVLAQAWEKESAADREAWVEMLRENLSPRDEPFLERALDDKSKTVRAMTAQVLVALPDSAFARRAWERARQYLSWKSSPLTKPKLKIELPVAWDEAWARDGLEQNGLRGAANKEAIGQRTWWLVQIIASVPPSTWEREWRARPEAILEVVRREDSALMEGFALAACRAQNPNWLRVLLRVREGSLRVPESYILNRIPPHDRDAILVSSLREIAPKKADEQLSAVFALLRAHDVPWSLELSRALLDVFRAAIRTSKANHYWMHSLASFAALMPPAVLNEAERGWPEPNDKDSWMQHRDALLDVLEARQQMRRELGLSPTLEV
jgi:hypothetical protein